MNKENNQKKKSSELMNRIIGGVVIAFFTVVIFPLLIKTCNDTTSTINKNYVLIGNLIYSDTDQPINIQKICIETLICDENPSLDGFAIRGLESVPSGIITLEITLDNGRIIKKNKNGNSFIVKDNILDIGTISIPFYSNERTPQPTSDELSTKEKLEKDLTTLAIGSNNEKLRTTIQSYFKIDAKVYLFDSEGSLFEGLIDGFLTRLDNRSKNYKITVHNETINLPLTKLEYSRYEEN